SPAGARRAVRTRIRRPGRGGRPLRTADRPAPNVEGVRFLFRPAWLAFIVGVVGFAVACYTLLAPWQFRRNAERERDNAAIAASQATAPVPLAQLVASTGGATPAPAQAVEWRRVTVRGHYLPG